MILSLEGVPAPARVTYHAQELSLLMARDDVDQNKIVSVKRALDEAFQEMLNQKGNNSVG